MAYLEQKRYVHCDLAGKLPFDLKWKKTFFFFIFKLEIFLLEN
jgi:hypothetical protein